jgi:hypothetical protein
MISVKNLGRVSVIAAVSIALTSWGQQAQKAPLTNADVVKMLRAGISEQIVLSTMRTRPATFDVSNQARAAFDKDCAGIKPAGVSTGAWPAEVKKIWDTMTDVVICQQTNGRGGEGACVPGGRQGSNAGSTPTPLKTNRPNKYESVTLQRGVTQDPGFANWVNSGQASVPSHEPPTLPPINSNPKREASPAADAATKAQIRSKLDLQTAAFKKSPTLSHVMVVRPSMAVPREISALQQQKNFVDTLRERAGLTPHKMSSSQLGANTETMAATPPIAAPPRTTTPAGSVVTSGAGTLLLNSGTNQSGSGRVPPPPATAPAGSIVTSGSGTLLLNSGTNQSGSGTVPPPQTTAPAGSIVTSGSGTLLLNSGTNQSGSGTVPPPQTTAPAGSIVASGSGTLLLNSGTNQGNSRTVAPPQTITPVGAPVMRQAASSAAQHQTVPNSPASAYAKIASGAVSGYVLWDTSTVHYQLSTPCQGLQVTVSSVSGGGLQALASSTSFTTPFGTQAVWNFSGKGSQGPWMVCGYVFHQMPEGAPLQVNAVVTQPSAFASPVSFNAPLQNSQVQIPGGNCGTTPDSTLATVLNSGPALCGDNAFNVNLAGLNARLNAAFTNSKVCLGAQIYTVNSIDRAENASNPVVFTQDPAYNDYIITGCGFGNGEGKQEVYLSGAVTGGRINMTILQWSPTQIEAVVQWGLTGVLDGWPDLNVVPADGGTPAKFPSCRFYAQRQSVLLLGIPQQYVHLASEQVGDGTHGFGTGYCPGPDLMHLFPCISFNGGYPLDGVSNGSSSVKSGPSTSVTNAVDRDGGQLKFSPGEDVYDLSYLAPGFAIDWFAAHWYYWSESVCEMWAAEDSEKPGDGINWDPAPASQYNWYQKSSTEIAVDWGVDHCAWRWLGMFNVDDEYNAGYSLEVHVKGPIGVDPWTGHPASQ